MLKSVNYSFQNQNFIRIKRKAMDIGLLVNGVQINVIMIIKIEYLSTIKLILKTID